MRPLRSVLAFMIAATVAGCGSDRGPAMPDVLGKKLDVAQSDIERAGFEDEVDVLGGGVFGIIKEANWEVCEQTPAPGKPLTKAPRLKVERDCDEDDRAAEGSAEPEVSDAATPTAEPTKPPTKQPTQPIDCKPKKSRNARLLTVENCTELAALLRGPATGASVKAFSEKYVSKNYEIEFDAFVADVYINPREHNGASTIDLMAGNAADPKHTGPVFQFSWYGHDSPLEKFSKGKNVRVRGDVGIVYEFEPYQFYLVEPEAGEAIAPR